MSTLADIITKVNSLTGYNIPATNVTYISSSNPAGQPIVVYTAAPPNNTIPTNGIYPGAVIKADHILRVINALNGVAANDIIISGSLTLPQIANGDFVYSISGTLAGTSGGGGSGSSSTALLYVATNITVYGSITAENIAIFSGSFLAAPSPLPPTSKSNFMFFVNGQLVDTNSITSFTDNNNGTCTLVVNTGSLDYTLESDDQILAIGKF